MSQTVKPGYKQTEVGVIPEEWEVAQLGTLSQTSSGTTPARAFQDRYYKNGTVAWVKTMDLGNADLITTSERVTEHALKETCLRVYPVGTVLVAMYGGFQQIGRTGLLRIPAAVNQAIVAIQPDTKKLDSEYIIGTLNYRIEYWKSIASSSRKDPNISSQDIRNFPIACPTVHEQRAIATALRDVDALLAALDRLIAKRRDLKQAAMQQLLTGQTRLPGFTGKWETKRLGEVGTCIRGVSYQGDSDLSSHDTASTKRLLRSNNVQESTIVISDVQFVNAARVSEKQILQKDDILICMANGSKALVGKAGLFSLDDGYPYTFGAFMGCFRNNSDAANSAFVFYLFQTGRYRDYINNLLAGSSINNLSPGSIESLEFLMPPLPEQTAIAAVLSDMDLELAALEQRRDKTRALKQGMMQELLTGRTRLV
jgi:type I restriction enzyme S subunit